MTQDLLAKWLKTVIVMSALCLLIVYAAVLPMVAKSIVRTVSSLEHILFSDGNPLRRRPHLRLENRSEYRP